MAAAGRVRLQPDPGDAERRHLRRSPAATPQNLVIAASAIAAVPTIVFFLIFQRNIMSGLTAGSLKG